MLAGVELRLECENSKRILMRITCLQNRCVYTISRISSVVFMSLTVMAKYKVINILDLTVDMQTVKHTILVLMLQSDF